MTFVLASYVALTLVSAGFDPRLLGATVSALALQWAILALANLAGLSRPWPRRHPLLAAIITLVVVIFTGLLAGGVLNAPFDAGILLWRFVLTLVVGALVLVLVQYRADVAAERAARQMLTEARDRGAEAVQGQRREVVTQLIRHLDEALAFQQPSSDGAATRVRSFARNRVRPLSHELMESLPPTIPIRSQRPAPVSWRQVLGSVTSMSTATPLLTAVVVTLVFIVRTVVTTGTPPPSAGEGSVAVTLDVSSLLWSWAGLALVFGVTYGVSWMVWRYTTPVLPRISLGWRIVLAMAAPLGIALAIEAAVQLAYLTPLVSDPLKSGFFERFFLAIPIVIVAFCVVLTRVFLELISSARRHERELTANLSWEVARIQETLRQERRFFALQTHGGVQSAAAAAAVRLDSAGDDIDLDTAWERVVSDLRSTIVALERGPADERDVADEINGLMVGWEGVCDISAELAPEALEALGRDWIAAASTVEVVTEALSNATMHGSAKRMQIDLGLSAPDVVLVRVVNDGQPLVADAAPGLGTTALDSISMSWGRANVPGGVYLWARIPVSPRHSAVASRG